MVYKGVPLSLPLLTCIDRSTPAPALNGRASSLPGVPASSASPSVRLSRGRGLQLGGKNASSSVLAAQLTEEVANEAGKGANHLWNHDLIDVNADEGDWSTFLWYKPRAGPSIRA